LFPPPPTPPEPQDELPDPEGAPRRAIGLRWSPLSICETAPPDENEPADAVVRRCFEPRSLIRPQIAISSAGTPMQRKTPPTIRPPSWPPWLDLTASSVSEEIKEVAPVAVKNRPHASTPQLMELLSERLPLAHGGSPRQAKIPAPIRPPKMLAVSSRMS